jgi:crossover junction endodeoxyribonuclease RuvC
MPELAYVGLDPSLTAFGVAAYGDGYQQTWLLKSTDRGIDRLLNLTYQLSDVFDEIQKSHAIADVAVEDTVRASLSASSLGELAGVVKLTCHTRLTGAGRYPLRVPPTTLKKFATGRGNAKKPEVMLSVFKKWGVEILDDNLADAYVLARIASGQAGTAYEKEVLGRLKDPKFRDGSDV